LARTDHAQPALFTVEYALAALVESYGIRPAALAGHSIGEYVAATVAGVFDLPTAITAVSARARLMHAAPSGVMVAVALSPDDVAEHLSPGLDIAAVNDPGNCVVSGAADAMAEFEDRLARRQVLAHARDGASAHPVPEWAVACAALGEDLQTFPAGLETEIGELGIRVSGGQRQRIALARAMAASGPRAPGLLVLDDPFSALDLDTEATIVAALRRLFGPSQPKALQCTIVLCSHRLSAFPQADRVVVLDHGRVREQGTHTELSAGNGLYARIYRAQRLVSTG